MQTHSADAELAPRSPARPPPEPLTYTLTTASVVCGLSKSTLYRREAEGLLRMVKVGGRRLVCAASLRTLLGTSA